MEAPKIDAALRNAPRHHEWTSVVPILGGLAWLLAGHGIGWIVVSLIPGSLLLGTGVSLLLWPGDAKITHYMALGSVVGLLLLLPAFLVGGSGAGTVGLISAVATFLVSGRAALLLANLPEGVPEPAHDWRIFFKAALDEALIGYFVLFARIPSEGEATNICAQAARLDATLREKRWLDDPASFHATPDAPLEVAFSDARWGKHSYQWMRFPSEFKPHPELPAAAEWSAHERNRECHVRLMRHAEPGRPWLLGIHGYRMGADFMDLNLFRPGLLHHKLGLNLVLPTLPLHGPRKRGARSGDFFLDGNLLDLVHAESQALWDLRRTIAWIRAQEPDARIGVIGYSLGGYNTALLAAHEPGLDFALAGIPVADFSATLWDNVPLPHRQYFATQGLDRERYARLLQVVSPLACPPKVAPERRFIFAGSADRVVVPAQPLMLAKHWGCPVDWFPGGHLTFRGQAVVRRNYEAAMFAAGWIPRPPQVPPAAVGVGEAQPAVN